MQTMRRAAVYSVKDRAAGVALLERLEARMNDSEKRGKPDSLAIFDVGYLLETYKQAYWRDGEKHIAAGRDGKSMIERAIKLRGNDPEMEFAAAITQADSRSDASVRTAHFKLALAGAKDGSLLATNLVKHAHLMQIKGNSLGDLRAQLN